MNSLDDEFFAALRPVIAAFDALEVKYYVGGSVASGIFGEPRQTLDADLIAALLGKHVGPFASQLQDDYYADEPMILRAVEQQSSFNLIHLPTMVKLDVYVSWRSEFARSQFSRRVWARLPRTSLELYVASPEDTVLAKLDWYRQGGGVSDRQWRDILGVLKVQGERIDLAYLRDWAARLNVTDLLLRAVDDARPTANG